MFTHVFESEPGDSGAMLGREWLLTNASGAYAMGTALGCNTRRYHGLLIAATRPPVGRIVALNQTLEQLIFNGPTSSPPPGIQWTTATFRTGEGGQVFAPDGQALLQRFERGLTVRWTYQAGAITLTRELLLHWRQQAVTLRYTLTGLAEPATLAVSPMLTLRDFHSLTQRDHGPAFHVTPSDDHVCVTRGDVAITLAGTHSRFVEQSDWWYGLHYPIEAQRGQDDHEDYFVPGRFEFALTPPVDGSAVQVNLTAAMGTLPAKPMGTMRSRASHLKPIEKAMLDASPTLATCLAIASDDFVVSRTIKGKRLSTILAGYPWFADWGRDTFIALPGLLLCTGRYAEARDVLEAFAREIADGLVPNRFDDYDNNAAHYNTVDASLWFVHAAVAYVQASGDTLAWDAFLADACCTILDAYASGTHYGIHMDGDGLIVAGSAQTQLTWMDAANQGVVFTPRYGKAVEINALWHHGLVSLAGALPRSYAQAIARYTRLADQVRTHFVQTFWNENLGGCYDTVHDGQADATVRPNMIFAASLAHSPLPMDKQQRLVNLVRDQLLTPVGLRTLPTDAPAYHGRYAGDAFSRDEAYHQGTIWPWLIGPYAEAVLRVGRFSQAARQEARSVIAPLTDRLLGEGVGQLHEIHEADTLAAAGCPAQAWSVAELLRVHQLIATDGWAVHTTG